MQVYYSRDEDKGCLATIALAGRQLDLKRFKRSTSELPGLQERAVSWKKCAFGELLVARH